MHKKLAIITLTMTMISAMLVGCTMNKKSEHHDSFSALEVENNHKDADIQNIENTESSESTETTEVQNTESSDTAGEPMKPDVSFAKQYGDIVADAAESVMSYEKSSDNEDDADENSVKNVLDTGNSIDNKYVINVINQAALNNEYEQFKLVNTEEIDKQQVYIVQLDYDYWIIFLDENKTSAVGYHDETGRLADMFGEKEEDIEYDDWD